MLTNAFYDEDYTFIEHVTGKRPKNQFMAETIINEYLSNKIRRKKGKFKLEKYMRTGRW